MATALTRLCGSTGAWSEQFQHGSGHQLWQVSVTSSDGGKLRGHDQFQPLNAARHPVAS